jgi:hypothetical protein
MESTRDKASGSRGSDFRLKYGKQPNFAVPLTLPNL